MNAWDLFLKNLGRLERVFVIGPLIKDPYVMRGPTIFVDGGIHARGRANERRDFPSVSVGDGDSATTALDFMLPKAKDYSDLAFVLAHLPLSVKHLELLGFLGGRRDHELANFGEAHAFLKRRQSFSTVSFDALVMGFCAGELKIKIQGAFALLALETCSATITGACRYTLPQATQLEPLSSRGISNIGSGEVALRADQPAFLFLQ